MSTSALDAEGRPPTMGSVETVGGPDRREFRVREDYI